MKKVFFTALACVAFATSGFASNEVVDNNLNKEIKDKVETYRKHIITVIKDGKEIAEIPYDGDSKYIGAIWDYLNHFYGGGCTFITTTAI